MDEKEIFELLNKETKKENEYIEKVNLFHKRFKKEIKQIGSILEGIESNSFGRIFPNDDNINMTNDKEIHDFFVFSTYSKFLFSGYKTLKSIDLLIIPDYAFGDILSLMRRYIEVLYIFIFFVFLEANYNKFEDKKKQEIKEWLNSKNEKLVKFASINDFIIKNEVITEILKVLKIDFEFLRAKRNNLNDFNHYNGLTYLNRDNLSFETKYKLLEEMFDEIKLYTKIFIMFCMTKCGSYCTSTDYVDYMETINKHIEGLQYITMPVLDEYIMKNFNEEELNYIKHNSYLKFGIESDLLMKKINDNLEHDS